MGDSYLERLTADWSPGRATGVDSTEHDTGAPCQQCSGTGRYEGATDPRDGTIEWLACPCTAPAPEATRMGALAALDRRAGPGADEAPAPEATGEMLWLCEGCGKVQTRSPEGGGHFTPPDDHCGPVVPLAEGVAALRTCAREAEEREAKWRRELSAACELSERAREIVVSALNQPPEHFYDKHDNGEWSAEHIAFAIRSLFAERDEAREQRKHASVEVGRLGLEVARLRDDYAAANARAEEMTHAHAAVVRSGEPETEAKVNEVKRLNGVVDEHAGGAMRAGLERDRAVTNAAMDARREGHLTEVHALRERIARLVEVGDKLPWNVIPEYRAAWAAAKADAPAAGGGR